jgi:hypothetical protein
MMARDSERPRPHGDPLQDIGDNPVQRQSDAPPDATAERDQDELPTTTSDRARGRGSSANGVPAFDEDDSELRRDQYDKGAGLVSGID